MDWLKMVGKAFGEKAVKPVCIIALTATVLYFIPQYLVTTTTYANGMKQMQKAVDTGDKVQRLGYIEIQLTRRMDEKKALLRAIGSRPPTAAESEMLMDLRSQISGLIKERENINAVLQNKWKK